MEFVILLTMENYRSCCYVYLSVENNSGDEKMLKVKPQWGAYRNWV